MHKPNHNSYACRNKSTLHEAAADAPVNSAARTRTVTDLVVKKSAPPLEGADRIQLFGAFAVRFFGVLSRSRLMHYPIAARMTSLRLIIKSTMETCSPP